MSIPFHSRITYQNRSKNEQAMPKGSKITLLGLDAKGNKNQKIRNNHPTNFCHIFQGKKNFSNQTSRNMRSGGGESRVNTILLCPYLYLYAKDLMLNESVNFHSNDLMAQI